MGIHHLFSIDEDQLRNWQGDPDDLLRNIGSAVVMTCLGQDNKDVTITDENPGATSDEPGWSLTVRHLDKHEGGQFAVWAWAAGDNICLADLSNDDLALLSQLSNAVLQGHFGGGDAK